MIKLENVCFSAAGKEILKQIHLEIKPGERVAILGPNGCGKTTLINVITENIKSSSGNIDRGQLAHLSKSKICYMMQHEEFHKDIKVKEAVELFRDIETPREQGQMLLKKFGMDTRMQSSYRKLSGGEKQKLNLICSLQNNPQYFFVDEVTTGLDALSRQQLVEHFVDIVDETKTFVMVTHYLEEAEISCNRFIFIKEGRIIADMSKQTLQTGDKSIFTLEDGTEVILSQDKAEAFMRENFFQIMKYEAKGNTSLAGVFEKLYGEGGGVYA